MKLHRKRANHSSAVQYIPSGSTFYEFKPVKAGDTVKNRRNRQFLLRSWDQQPLRSIGCVHSNCSNPLPNSCSTASNSHLTASKCRRDSAAWWIRPVVGPGATLWGRQRASQRWIAIVWLFGLTEPPDAANAGRYQCVSASYWASWPSSSEFR